ncbi:MAG: hypothetical protein C4575_06680 [Desulforudis sp.]|nr:MAG: hypothetical protein C4575_06680 [Desulforudis sp.]
MKKKNMISIMIALLFGLYFEISFAGMSASQALFDVSDSSTGDSIDNAEVWCNSYDGQTRIDAEERNKEGKLYSIWFHNEDLKKGMALCDVEAQGYQKIPTLNIPFNGQINKIKLQRN